MMDISFIWNLNSRSFFKNISYVIFSRIKLLRLKIYILKDE